MCVCGRLLPALICFVLVVAHITVRPALCRRQVGIAAYPTARSPVEPERSPFRNVVRLS
jgi:hypothetical protein